ncbi:MAG: oligosaccharide flippase family protein [Candidatus Thiodiazotropha endolucinida]|nr:oligosaccharide flippase family protein [Candidatus Thiodiazotropha taylori]MCG8053246.1 oligosaccharide flippase family protein [Candidatus Thiodiazotropha taylori]MCG8096262.1 oligosaccharide flippase family protein [Candidatus Thiodiazotropha endolucinida]MCW4315066.1 oligosaccharide flippase family protein [Candidatus Thiodiazotropha taylori]MCW4321129.1 oligosaccharide flippase family protein [Candidatus Thiodiazotropha taylori]
MTLDKVTDSVYSGERVRKSLIQFLLGRTFSAVVGFGLLLLLVRSLDVIEYGFYIASQAILEIIGTMSSLGLIVAAQRYLPELHNKNDGVALYRLTIKLLVGRFVTLILASLILFVLAEWILGLLKLEHLLLIFQVFLLVIIIENIARYIDIIFDSLLLQGLTQISIIIRVGLRFLPLVILVLWNEIELTLLHWILIEIFASTIAVIWSCYKLYYYLIYFSKRYSKKQIELNIKRYLKYSLPAFIAAVLYMLSSTNSVKLIAANLLSAYSFATFGFAIAVALMLQRYMPIFLLIGMIRPLFVVAKNHVDYRIKLPKIAELVFKLNAFALLPIISIFWIFEDSIAVLLSGGRYPEAGGFLIIFMLLLVMQAFRAILSMTAQAMENAKAALVGTLLGIIGLSIGIVFSYSLGGYGLCIGLIISEVIFSVWVIKSLYEQNIVFKIDVKGYAKLIVSAVVPVLIVQNLIPNLSDLPLIKLIVYSSLIMFMYLIINYYMKPFTIRESSEVNKLLGKKIFIW